MNRAERRRSAKHQEKPKTYVLTEDQIQQIKREAAAQATRRAFVMFMSIPIMVLRDKFGFGKTRLARFMEYALTWYESILCDETKITEVVKVAEEECGIKIMDYLGGSK